MIEDDEAFVDAEPGYDLPNPTASVTNESIVSYEQRGDTEQQEQVEGGSEENEEEDRFDASMTINSAAVDPMKARVMSKAAEKKQAFSGAEDKTFVLGKNWIRLSRFKNLDPNAPDKVYTLYVVYIALLIFKSLNEMFVINLKK